MGIWPLATPRFRGADKPRGQRILSRALLLALISSVTDLRSPVLASGPRKYFERRECPFSIALFIGRESGGVTHDARVCVP